MTYPRPTDEDELISRVLDGDATEVDRARVASDARLQARVHAFERARAAIAEVESPPAAAREAAIAAALAEAAPVDATDDRASPQTLAYARARRRRRAATVLAAAAALLIGVPLLAIALNGRGTEQQSADTAGVETAADAPNETVAPPFADALEASGYAGDLGALDTDAQLQAAVAVALASAPAANYDSAVQSQLGLPPPTAEAGTAGRSSSSVPESPPSCITSLAAAEPGLGAAVLTATATWQGDPALVVVYRGVTDTVVVMNDGCTVLVRLPA